MLTPRVLSPALVIAALLQATLCAANSSVDCNVLVQIPPAQPSGDRDTDFANTKVVLMKDFSAPANSDAKVTSIVDPTSKLEFRVLPSISNEPGQPEQLILSIVPPGKKMALAHVITGPVQSNTGAILSTSFGKYTAALNCRY